MLFKWHFQQNGSRKKCRLNKEVISNRALTVCSELKAHDVAKIVFLLLAKYHRRRQWPALIAASNCWLYRLYSRIRTASYTKYIHLYSLARQQRENKQKVNANIHTTCADTEDQSTCMYAVGITASGRISVSLFDRGKKFRFISALMWLAVDVCLRSSNVADLFISLLMK